MLKRPLDYLLAVLLIANVSGQQEAFSSFCFNLLFCFARVPMLVQVRNCNVSAFFGEEDSYSPADTAVSPANKGNLPLQLSYGSTVQFLRYRARFHFPFL